MLRFVPPAGAPLSAIAALQAWKQVVLGQARPEECLDSLTSWLGVRYGFGVRSGRAGLWLILNALHRLRPERSTVVLPAYTCFTVAASIVRAGLRPCPVEIDPHTLDFNFAELEAVPSERLLCVISSSLLGFASDVERAGKVAHAKGAFVVDDAAQALGASRKGRFAGSGGDAGLFSFGRGKPAAAIEGGVVVTDSEEISRAIQTDLTRLPRPSLPHTGWLLFQVLAYRAFLSPSLYWIPNSLPFLKLGTTEFAPDFPVSSLPTLSSALFPYLMERLPWLHEARRANARIIAESLRGNASFSMPRPSEDSQAGYLRFPVLAADEESRNRAVFELQKAGIGASAFYPAAICDIPGLASYGNGRFHHCPEAESLARRLFTLPTHPLVSKKDLSRMLKVLATVSLRGQVSGHSEMARL
jgi:perosamine synthetase